MADKQALPVVRGEKPYRKGNRKLLFLLFLFFLALLGVLFFQSSFSKINRIEVTGVRLLSEQQVLQASGVSVGDHFFAVGGKELEERIKQLEAVDTVEVSKRFPGRVHFQIQEYGVVALELDDSGGLSGLLSNGHAIPYDKTDQASPRPLLTGWDNPELKAALCLALSRISLEHLQDVSEIRPDPSESYEDRIMMYTRSRYEVITRISYLADKISLLDDYVHEMQSGGKDTGRIVLLETDYGEAFETDFPETEIEE